MHSVRTARGLPLLLALVAVSLLLGACCKQPEKASPVWTVEVWPVEDTNPTKTQHTFVATVYDQDGRPVPNVQVHWILARTGDAVGDIVMYDDQDLGDGTWLDITWKTDNQFAVSYTNDEPEVLHRGMRWVADEASWTDFEVGVGQSWCTITSPVEGDSHMIVFVPAIEDALCHKVFAIKHWEKVPHLVVTKECPDQALVGDEFEYRITVMNDGDGATPGDVILTDAMPDGITVVDGTSFPQNLGVMNPGDQRTLNFRVRAETSGVKLNRTEARAGEFVARADCTTNVYGYGIDLVKECAGRYAIGDAVPFTIRVTNTESATLTNVVVNDPLPAGVEFLSAETTTGAARMGADGRTVVWDGFELAAGATAQLTINTTAKMKSTPTNTATVTANVMGGSAQVTDTDSCQVEIVGLPKLNIEKICDPTMVSYGDPVTFRITVWNTGGEAATNVVVNDMVPAGLEAMGDTAWTIPSLAPSDKMGGQTFTLQARAMQAGTFTNVAVAQADGTAEVRDSCDVVVKAPTLTITKECQAATPLLADDITVLNRMDKATHVITVKNGDATAQDVVVVDRIPLDSSGRERIRYVSSNPEGVYDAGTHTVTWNLGTMAAGQTAVLNVTFEGRTIGPAINTASVTARGFGGAQDECRLYVLGSPAFQEAVVDAANGNPDADGFYVNTPFYYVAMVQNEGDADLKIDMTFTLSSELAFDASTPTGFISDVRSTATPTGANVLQVTDLGGGKYQLTGFNLAPRSVKWIKIPVKGVQITTTDAATIDIEFKWQLWYEGRLFPRSGVVSDGETTVIDPE